MKRSLLIGCAGMAVASAAMAQDVARPSAIPAGVGVKRMYVNMRTGERQVTEVSQRIGAQVWGYETTDSPGFYFGAWGSGGAGWDDTEMWDSGQLAATATIDGIELFYYAAGTQSAATTFPLAFAVSDDYELCAATYPTLTSGVFGDDLAPADPGFSWILQYDLAGFEFTINGDATDFGYAYYIDTANATEVVGATGPILVNDVPDTAPGAQDAFEGLDVDATGAGCWFFGGWTPDLDPSDPNYNPFSQFYIKLFGAGGCAADFNGDQFLDFFDYDDYVNCFETGNCPPGKTADFNGDQFVDFFDYDDFVFAFENGC